MVMVLLLVSDVKSVTIAAREAINQAAVGNSGRHTVDGSTAARLESRILHDLLPRTA